MSKIAANGDYTTVSARTTKELKANAEKVLDALHIPMSTAINLYLNQITIQRGIPFPVSLNIPNETTLAAMQEADDILSGKVPGHPQSVASFLAEMGE